MFVLKIYLVGKMWTLDVIFLFFILSYFFYLNFFIFKLFLLAMLFLSVICVIIKLILEILSRQELFCKIPVLKNFANFTGKYLCLSVFLNKFVTLQAVCQNISENFFLWNGCEKLLLRIPSKLTSLTNATGLFLYLLKKSGNHWFSDDFRGCRKIVTRNELNKNMLWKSYAIVISLLWLRSISYWNQSIDLLCKSVGWFQYDREIRHKSVVRSLILFMNIILFDKTNNQKFRGSIIFVCLCFWFQGPCNIWLTNKMGAYDIVF